MNKVLKIAGKIIGWFFAAVFGILTVLCIITLIWGGVQQVRGHVTNTLPETPADFVPAVRLIVFTDTHNENDNVADAIDTAYRLFDEDPVYAGVDGFFGLGDFSSVGFEPDYANYTATLKEHVRPETTLVNIHGNHEFKNVNEYHDLFIKYFGHEPNTVTEINGFSCIAFSGDRGLTEWTFTPSSLKWLSNAINEAEKKADGKAIFVFNHPHPWGTVYGSTVWGDPELNFVLNGHTAVVDFSGHSHFPLNDPRSINQASYTAVGCGGMARFELDNNGIVGQHPDGWEDAAEMVVLEADNDGSVRIRGYDLLSDTYFCDYYIDNVNDKDDFAYTYKNMKAHDAAPKFNEDASATAYKNENGEWVISFTEATPAEGYIVHEYKVTIKDENGKKIFGKNFIDDYYIIDDDNTADFRIGTDTLVAGKTYTLLVRAESAYHLYSDTVAMDFIAQESAPAPVLSGRTVMHETEFGGVYIDCSIDDFNALGFAYGDSVNVSFSNGYTMENLPYYNGYYTQTGQPLVVAYPGYPYIKVCINNGDDLWTIADLAEDDTAEITLAERNTFSAIQNARDIHYEDDRSLFESDEVFANFRSVNVTGISDNMLYRSASPCDNQYNRASFVDDLIKEAGVKCILNLSDNKEKLQGYINAEDFNSAYFLSLYEGGNVIPLALNMNYGSDEFREKVAKGLIEMLQHDGPYLVHCTEGKDRTGFVCMLLEALCGACYQEIVDDYMITYDNYYNITKSDDAERYDVIVENVLDPMVRSMIGDEKADLSSADLAQAAQRLLLDAGMTESQIEELKAKLSA